MSKLSRLAAGSAVLAAVAIGGAGMALADGYKAKKVVYERPADWSGVYFGVSSGYHWSGVELTNPTFPAAAFSGDHSDGLAGAHIGLQHQFGAIVLGVEAGWQSSFRIEDGDRQACFGPVTGIQPGTPANCFGQFNDVLTLGARVGYAAGHWMPYLTGGYANGGFDYRAASLAGVTFERAQTRLSGWYIGAGAEWIVSPGWTAGIEYRHYEFDGDNVTTFSVPGGAAVVPARFEGDSDSITARVSWRWGRPDGGMAPLK